MNGQKARMTRRVKVRAIESNFYLDGRVAQVGQVGEVDYADGVTLEKCGKARILGDAAPRTWPADFFKEPPALRPSVWG